MKMMNTLTTQAREGRTRRVLTPTPRVRVEELKARNPVTAMKISVTEDIGGKEWEKHPTQDQGHDQDHTTC